MRNQITLLGMACCLMAGPALANQGSASKSEAVGVGTGATIGALAGGPVGLIIGAAIGAKIGDEFAQRNGDVDTLSNSLAGSRQRVASLEQNINALTSDIDDMGLELQRLQWVARPELLDLMQAGIEMDLLFRTDEHVLVEVTGKRLTGLATSLAKMPDVYLKLDGFADERGDAAYNKRLSALRIDHVKQLLMGRGVSETRILSEAHGESPSIDGNADSYALDRKVSMTLFVEDAPSFAAQ